MLLNIISDNINVSSDRMVARASAVADSRSQKRQAQNYQESLLAAIQKASIPHAVSASRFDYLNDPSSEDSFERSMQLDSADGEADAPKPPPPMPDPLCVVELQFLSATATSAMVYGRAPANQSRLDIFG